MWRIIKSLGRGLRSVRPSQCGPQENNDEKKRKQLEAPQSLASWTLRCYSTTQDKCLAAGKWKTEPLLALSSGGAVHTKELKLSDIPFVCQRGSVANCHTSSGDSDSSVGGGARSKNDHSKPPWLWQIILDHYPQEKLSDENNEKRQEGSQDWESKCWCEQFLLTYSILHGLGWGSAVAFTWSVCRDLVDQRNYPFWQRRCQRRGGHTSRAQRHKPCPDEGNQENNVHFKNDHQCFDERSYIVKEEYEKCYMIDIQDWEGRLAHLVLQSQCCSSQAQGHRCLSLNSYVSEIKRAIISKSQVKNEVPDHLLSRFGLELENLENIFLINSNAEQPVHIRDANCEVESELTAENGSQGLHDGHSSQSNVADSGCVSDCSKSYTSHESDLEQKGCRENQVSTQETQTEDLSTEVSSEFIEGLLQKEPAASTVATRSEVWIEDCPESEDEDGKRETSVHLGCSQANDNGICQFSDSLLEALAAGREDIRTLEGQFKGVLESEVGVSLVESEPGRAAEWFRTGALLGDPAATFNFALCYHTGQGVDQDLRMARELYEAASLAGHGWASYNLAVMVSRGEGGPVDSDRGHHLLVLAAHRGVQQAHQALHLIQQHKETQAAEVRYSQSEPTLSVPPAPSWSSSYSISDLTWMEEPDTYIACDLSTDIARLQENKAQFSL